MNFAIADWVIMSQEPICPFVAIASSGSNGGSTMHAVVDQGHGPYSLNPCRPRARGEASKGSDGLTVEPELTALVVFQDQTIRPSGRQARSTTAVRGAGSSAVPTGN